MPLPQIDDTNTVPSEPAADEHCDSDEEFDIIDFPEVPRQPFHSNKHAASAPEMLPFPASALSDDDDEDEPNDDENLAHPELGVVLEPNSVVREDKQFLPFTHPPSQSTVPLPMREEVNSPPSVEYYNADLQDVLAAALEAANSAEHAAAAARSAASLAQLRITQLMKQKNDDVSISDIENPFHHDVSISYIENPFHDDKPNEGKADGKGEFDSSPHGTLHQPQRLPRMDQDTYFSYPNLFTSQGSNLSSRVKYLTDSK